jgi:hypothetical protein
LPKLLAELDIDEAHGGEPRTPLPTPERSLMALDELAAIDRLFADDHRALLVIASLAEGKSPEEICTEHQLSKTDYDSTRKRIRRVLLREGLRSPQP